MLEQADLGVGRAGERAAHVAEQLALEQRLDDGGTVHRDQAPILARAEAMQRLGDQFLAGAGFAGDQHRARVRREPAHRVEQLLHAGAATDEAVELELARDVRVDAQQRLAALEALAHRDQQLAQPIEIERLRDVVERTGFDRFDGGVDRSRVGHQDHLRLRIGRLDLAQHAQAVDARQLHVHDRAVRADDRKLRQRGMTVRLPDDAEPELGRKTIDQREHRGVVVDDEQGRRLGEVGVHARIQDSRMQGH